MSARLKMSVLRLRQLSICHPRCRCRRIEHSLLSSRVHMRRSTAMDFVPGADAPERYVVLGRSVSAAFKHCRSSYRNRNKFARLQVRKTHSLAYVFAAVRNRSISSSTSRRLLAAAP